MRLFFITAAALAATSSAFAYQTYSTHPGHATTATAPSLVVPASWTAEQRALWEEQMHYHPGWTPDQIAAFEAMMAIPPANWTPEQRALFAEHLGHIPPSWTEEQRAAFASMVDTMRTPWMSETQTAVVDQGPMPTAQTTYAQAPASAPVVQPSNANPEHDARGIPVISDVAYVPPGYNGIPATAMGGPVEGDDESYPPCTAERTDNCTQTYEVD